LRAIKEYGRSTRDLLNTLDAIAKKGGKFKSLGDTWADTTTPHGKLILTILGGSAEFERALILDRQAKVEPVPKPAESTWDDRRH
jgi:DNA invertase Pin-like site-specific DNA recombinase